jgi:hypothetical protein
MDWREGDNVRRYISLLFRKCTIDFSYGCMAQRIQTLPGYPYSTVNIHSVTVHREAPSHCRCSNGFIHFQYTRLGPARLRSKKETRHAKSSILLLLPLALTVRLGRVVALVDDEVLGAVVLAAREVRVEDGLGAGGVSLDYELATIYARRTGTRDWYKGGIPSARRWRYQTCAAPWRCRLPMRSGQCGAGDPWERVAGTRRHRRNHGAGRT